MLHCAVVVAQSPTLGKLQKVVTYHDKNKLGVREVYYVLKNQPNILEGEFISFYQNGNIETKGQYKNGRRTGMWEQYYEKGTLKQQQEYVDDIPDGITRIYFENGKLNREGVTRKGQKDGIWQFYFENGTLKSKGIYERGVMEGLWQYFREDSTLKATSLFENGIGHYKEVYPSGQLKMEGFIKNGKSDSIWTYYYESGQIQATGKEKNGMKNGYWKFFHPNGKVSSEGHFKKNVAYGKWKYYHENGNLSSEGEQLDGAKHGVWKVYFPDGKVMGEGNFEKGSGEYVEYHENGKIKVKGMLKNGIHEGLWIYYFDDGEKEGECFYENGEGNFKSYYSNGNLKMEGKLKNGQKTGVWKLYTEDGKLAAMYKTYYELETSLQKNTPKPKPIDTLVVLPPRNTEKPALILNRRGSRHFRPRINELAGIIIASNPAAVVLNSLPISAEYYFNERLGYEGIFTYYRKPFFANHNELPENRRTYTTGTSFGFRQKLYKHDRGSGAFYWAQEGRVTALRHKALSLDFQGDTSVNETRFRADEIKVEVSLLFGDRIFKEYSKKNTFTIDIFAGLGVGYRFHNIDQSTVFKDLRTNKIIFPFRLGIMAGYFF
jgi:antitoxin component YwqK of YwqJK toxin-antitoxin module